jgi:hypothetical protein
MAIVMPLVNKIKELIPVANLGKIGIPKGGHSGRSERHTQRADTAPVKNMSSVAKRISIPN